MAGRKKPENTRKFRGFPTKDNPSFAREFAEGQTPYSTKASGDAMNYCKLAQCCDCLLASAACCLLVRKGVLCTAALVRPKGLCTAQGRANAIVTNIAVWHVGIVSYEGPCYAHCEAGVSTNCLYAASVY